MTDSSNLLYVLSPQDKVLELMVLYVPNQKVITTHMQLSCMQLKHAQTTPFVGGYRLAEADKEILSKIYEHAVSQKINASQDKFPLTGNSKPLFDLLMTLPNTRVTTKSGYELPKLSPDLQTLDLTWIITSDGLARLSPLTEKNLQVFSSLNPFGLDKKTNTFYYLSHPAPPKEIAAALLWPAITFKECASIAKQIKDSWSTHLPAPPHNTPEILEDLPLEPYLFICTEPEDIFNPMPQTYLSLCYGYGAYIFSGKEAGSAVNKDGKWAYVKRKPNQEVMLAHELTKFGFFEQPSKRTNSKDLKFFPTKAVDWDYFLTKGVAFLKKSGWHVQIEDDVAEKLEEITDIIVEHREVSNDWFELDLGFKINDKPYDLSSVLGTLFKKDSRWLNRQALDAIDDDELIEIKIPEESKKAVIKARLLKPLALNIIDFFDNPRASVHKKDIARFALALDPYIGGNKFFSKSKEDLKNFDTINPISIPAEVTAQLRTYQEYGVSWLQHMLNHEFGAILADDRGLGKTLQSIAHLAIEYFSKKTTKPSLIVVEASLWEKWQREFEKFCPTLCVEVLYAKTAKTTAIEDGKVYITTYTTLKQYLPKFQAQSWHILIMDEAQNAKNYKTANAQALASLECVQKICVTGTPIENNLAELWSLFNFILPGFLGSLKEFTKNWRRPIEEEGNTVKQKILAKRCAPFILLRKKSVVAPEIPDKNILPPVMIEFDDSQRHLYDAIHVSMTEKVMEQIEKVGLKKSNIIILDALLKLRQICCDPALIGKEVASAKKQKALEIIKSIVSQGKKIVVFSQFRTMLEILEKDLIALGIPYTMLTGLTKKRQEKVDLFETGCAQVFLISLKAGGKGLDLLQADAVLLYDPWWNPAAEDQAMDRAHRIGQTKSVAFYRLLCKNTVEEKILALQAKKASLANGILDEALDGLSSKISTQDLLDLLLN